ncbi:MAG: carboxypeptidase regulatory-like domain-containing protein [Nitrospirae bacterium]|nr:carboxypeptidase regulatory-like domain-containing protein [Nitrospirota bacterium]
MIKKIIFLSFLIAVLSATAIHAEIETGWISGQIMIKDDGPLADAMIVFFDTQSGPPPSLDKYFRVPNGIDEINAEGRFRISLPAGKYYIGAIKRASTEKAGPPLDGDYFFISGDKEGNPIQHVIEYGKELKLGALAGAVPYKRSLPEGVTGISGTILDMAGKPVEGAILFAYYTETMTGIPTFTSYKTGKDGKYIITVDKGGQYFLRVRDVYGGGPPIPGSIMGGYGEEKPTAATAKTGEMTKGIDIKVIRHLEMGPKHQPGAGADENFRENQIKKMQQEMEKKIENKK